MVTSDRDDKRIHMCVKIYRRMNAAIMNADWSHYNKRQITFTSEANTSECNYRVKVTGATICA